MLTRHQPSPSPSNSPSPKASARPWWRLFAVVLVAATWLGALGAKKACHPVEPEVPICVDPAEDCASLTPAANCLGAWTCASDATCQWVCDPPPVELCESNLDCSPGEQCVCEMDCSPFPGACPEVCTCQPAPPQFGVCTSDAGCPPGTSCTASEDCLPCANCPLCAVCCGVCEPDEPEPVECFVGGCSGQICSPYEGIITTCEWLPWYACFSQSECGPHGPGGTCAWKKTEAFLDCWQDQGGPLTP